MQAANVSWDGGGDGVSWSDPLNWSGNTLPGSLDNVTIDVAAEPVIQVTNLNVTVQGLNVQEAMRFAEANFAVNGIFEFRHKTLTVESGMLQAFSIQSSNATVRYQGGNLFTAVFIRNGTLHMDGGTNFADFILEGMCALTGSMVLGQSITVRGLDGATTIATAPTGFACDGLLRLESTPSALTTMFRVNAGALSIGPNGLLLMEPGGGAHVIDATLDNRGSLLANGDFNVTGSMTNSGVIQLAPSLALQLDIQPGRVFEQTTGQLLVPSDASLYLRNPNKNAVPLPVITLAGGTVDAPLLDLENLALVLRGTQLSGSTTLRMRGDKCSLQGEIDANQVVWVHAEPGINTLVTAFGVITNLGTLRLLNDSATNQAVFRVSGGYLRNEPSATIECLPGGGGDLTVDTHIDNRGLFLNGAPFNFLGSITNTGTFQAAPGTDSSFTLRAGQQYRQTTGTIEVPPGASLRFANGDKGFVPQAAVRLLGGTVTGSGFISENISLQLGGDSIAGTFTIALEDDLNALTGLIGPSQTLWIRGTASRPGILQSVGSITNAGTLRMENADALGESRLALNSGALENLAGATLDLQPGAGGTRVIQADINNQGTVQVNAGFTLVGSFFNTGLMRVLPFVDAVIHLSPGESFQQTAGMTEVTNTARLRLRSSLPNSVPLGAVQLSGGSVSAEEMVLENINATLDGPQVNGVFTLAFEDDKNSLAGSIAAGQTVWIRGSTNGNALLAYSGVLLNEGTLRFENIEPGRESRISIASGSIMNSGQLLIREGAGGTRVIHTTVDNPGEIHVFADFDLSGNLTNRGLFRVETNVALHVSLASGRAFTQTDGLFQVMPGATTSLRSENKLVVPLPAVTLTGGQIQAPEVVIESVTLTLDGPNLGGNFALTFENDRNSFLGTLAQGQTLGVRGTTNAPALVIFLSGTTHQGTVRLETLSPLNEARIRMNAVPLVLGTQGRLQINEGLGSNLAIEGNVGNLGVVDAETSFVVSGSFTNNGVFAVAADKSVVYPISAGQVFRQSTGSIQIPATGTLRLKSANKNAQPLAALQILGGSVDGQGLISESTSLTLQGTQVAGSCMITVENNINGFSGTVQNGQTLRLLGRPGVPAQLYVFTSFTNQGTIELDGTAPGTVSDLILNAGPLVNGPQGAFKSRGGSGSERRLMGTMENRGLLQVENGTLAYVGATLISQPGAVIAGTGLLNLSGASLQNHGTLRPGLPIGALQIQGAVANSPSSRIEIDIAGASPGVDVDQVQVTGASDTRGTLAVSVQDGFIPTAGQELPVFTYASRQGQYTTMEGLIVNETIGYETLYQPASFRLRAVDLPGSPPQITMQPVGGPVAPGQSLTLEVLASGPPPLTYQWRRNGVNIPGATTPILVLTNNQPMDGGTYRVVVANDAGAVKSDKVPITVSTPGLIVADAFNFAGTLIGPSGLGNANNTTATLEPGEPLHAGKPGGHSVWAKWTASFTGVASFNTAGSTFDTLLAVYQGTTVSNLTQVAAQDEGAGFHTSSVSFNATAGQTYRIAIDGDQGATGTFLLNWSLALGAPVLPLIQAHPIGVVTNEGASASFSVSATGPAPLGYQWLRNGQLVPDATNATLLVASATTTEIGTYQVRITGGTGGQVLSQPASLELASLAAPLTSDKLEDLFATGALPPMNVAPGATLQNVFDNATSETQEEEPLHDGKIGGSTRWFGPFLATGGGSVQLNTGGTEFDTILAVYTGTGYGSLNLVASDDDGAADGLRSRVQFNITSGTRYVVAVDGKAGARGLIHLNWGGGAPPQAIGPIPPVAVLRGGRVVLPAMMTPGEPAGTYQWYRNNAPIPGATGTTLILDPVMDDADYEVRVTNPLGMAINPAQVILVQGSISLPSAGGAPGFVFMGTASGALLIEATTTFQSWTPVYTNTLPGVPFEFEDPMASSLPARFYRFKPWPATAPILPLLAP